MLDPDHYFLSRTERRQVETAVSNTRRLRVRVTVEQLRGGCVLYRLEGGETAADKIEQAAASSSVVAAKATSRLDECRLATVTPWFGEDAGGDVLR